ncbi:hypothetical protein RHMOL_Rhmol13G0228200 [Rhododendron molle]|uniref:Uncharacterized protein n=1 Tax=Rhododendron molle TaxID=49168 RepID=A0ACC0LA59_RHOML|nr:hypothetical protein RHMOL_Rhmol13G0228200 [Rhododendron molle]
MSGYVISSAKNWTRENMRVGYVPVLKLPMSGYVMKGVTIINFRLYGDDDYEADLAMLDAFAEEQGVFFRSHGADSGKAQGWYQVELKIDAISELRLYFFFLLLLSFDLPAKNIAAMLISLI